MYSATALLLLVGSALATERNFTTIQPTGTFNPAAATAVQTVYPKDHHIVRGRYCDHIWNIVLDNADYEDAANNDDLQHLASQGLVLDNYYAVDSNSQANYLAMIGGDTFGLTEERFVSLPSNVTTLVEAFDEKRVLWAQYAEDQPFTAYDGWEYPAEDPTYSRAKNPFVAFDSVMEKSKYFNNLRSLATLDNDLESHHFPQWLFIRPNLQNDGTKSDLATAAKWVRNFLEPHISDKKAYHRKLFIVTFARSSSTNGPNRVWSVILGDIHDDLRGDKDSTYYDHYSILASAEANYELPSLGRYDCSANVFSVINKKAKFHNRDSPEITDKYNQGPFAGYLSDDTIDLPVPNLICDNNRDGVLRRVRKQWKKASYSYEDWVRNY